MKFVAKLNMRSYSKVRVHISIGISIYDWFYIRLSVVCYRHCVFGTKINEMKRDKRLSDVSYSESSEIIRCSED